MPSAARKGYDFFALLRAALALTLFYGLTNGTPAIAAPPMGPPEPGNPFEDRGNDSAGTTPATTPRQPAPRIGDDDDADAAEDSAESALHGLACLEGDATGGRRKGVQRRDFLKRHRFELSGLGGFYASDALSSTYSYGGALAFYPSEDFGLEVLLTRTPMRFRLEQPFNAFDQQTHFQAERRLAGDLLAALVAHPREAEVHRDDDHARRPVRRRGRGAHRRSDRAGPDLGGGRGRKLYFNGSSRSGSTCATSWCRRRCWAAGASPTT